MSLLLENVIPGNRGKVFETNAKDKNDLDRIKDKILSIKGVKEVIINRQIFPIEFTVHTSGLVSVKDIEEQVISVGFHVIPKGLLGL